MTNEEKLKAYIDQIPLPDTLEQAIAERNAWIESAMQFSRNEDYYRGLVVRIGEAIGPEAYTADDGSISEDVLCAKVPELIEASATWECGARKQSLPEPADCNWPVCGCDPVANKVMEALDESLPPPGLFDALLAMEREFGRVPGEYSAGQIAAIADARRVLAARTRVKPTTEPCTKLDPQGSAHRPIDRSDYQDKAAIDRENYHDRKAAMP